MRTTQNHQSSRHQRACAALKLHVHTVVLFGGMFIPPVTFARTRVTSSPTKQRN